MRLTVWAAAAALALLLLAGCGGSLDGLDFHPAVAVSGTAATVSVEVTGIKNPHLVHVHLFLDGGPELMMYDDTYTYRDLAPGEHELVVELARQNHEPVPGQRKTVRFAVPEDGP